jgi:hypothetical protein
MTPDLAIQGEHYAFFDHENLPGRPVRYIFDTLENARAAIVLLPAIPEWGRSQGLLRMQKPEFDDGWKPSDSGH